MNDTTLQHIKFWISCFLSNVKIDVKILVSDGISFSSPHKPVKESWAQRTSTSFGIGISWTQVKFNVWPTNCVTGTSIGQELWLFLACASTPISWPTCLEKCYKMTQTKVWDICSISCKLISTTYIPVPSGLSVQLFKIFQTRTLRWE